MIDADAKSAMKLLRSVGTPDTKLRSASQP